MVLMASAGGGASLGADKALQEVKPVPREQLVSVASEKIAIPGAEKLLYKTIGDVKLHLFVFKPADWKATDTRTVIVFFHGGGWTGGSAVQFIPQCRYAAERGMVAITVSYRLGGLHRTSPRECVKDARSAVRWVRTHAKDLGIDPDRLAASGGSAGGHMAACCAMGKDCDEEGEDTKVSCMPNALVLFNPVLSAGGEKMKGLSPMELVVPELPPTLIQLGEEDTIVPPAKAQQFVEAMRGKGNRCELKVYPKVGHGFFNKEESLATTLREMDAFLVSLKYLSSPPPDAGR